MAGVVHDRLCATLKLDEPVVSVNQISSSRAKELQKLGIFSVRDLLWHFPRRYLDLSSVETIASASIGQSCTIYGSIHEVKLKKPKPRLQLVEITIVDKTSVMIVTAFRQPWLARTLKPGMQVAIAGNIEFNFGFKRMTNPVIHIIEKQDVSAGMIISIHPACEKISANMMRRYIHNALELTEGLIDPLPVDMRLKYHLMSRQHALRAIHFPHTMDEVRLARRRLAFEQLLIVELMLMKENVMRNLRGHPCEHVIDGQYMRAFAACLPFKLTCDQQKARDDILQHMAEAKISNHLVLGDVGTGKTILAGFAIAAVADSRKQALMMAPTELLARQHAQSLGPLFDQIGITWEVLCGSSSAAEKSAICARLSSGTIDVVIGTHALLEAAVVPKDCSLIIIDEQQRFGVEQRECLISKGNCADALYLTATPIPRTLALAVYGNLSLSYLTEKPHNQAGRTTRVLRPQDKGIAYDAARQALERGEQVYVVCPLIGQTAAAHSRQADQVSSTTNQDAAHHEEESYEYASIRIEDENDYLETNLAAAEKEADILQSTVFVDYRVGLLHGRMSATQKQETMDAFRQGHVQVLVTTTVIEVGVDVDNATIMIIQDADRFGLSQLHQLRGRVGRGTLAGEVFLLSNSQAPTALDRLSAMERTEDGFELATYDLSLRREGDILGNRQHGASLLSLVKITRDGAMIEAAHDEAQALLDSDPELVCVQNAQLAREIRCAFGESRVRQGG